MPDRDHFIHPEKHRLEPFGICGNLYYVGDDDVCAYLIDSGEGLILIDTGYPTGQAGLIHSIWSLGFDPKAIRAILHTHGHYDHMGATGFLKEISGASTYLSRNDAAIMRERPELALWSDIAGFAVEKLFVPDKELADGDTVSLGNVSIRAVETPGHTPGTLSFFFDVTDKGRAVSAGIFGGVGRNTMRRSFERAYGVSGYRESFAESLKKMKRERPVITLGTHTDQAFFMQNRQALLAGAEPNPFTDASQWPQFLTLLERKLAQLAEEDP